MRVTGTDHCWLEWGGPCLPWLAEGHVGVALQGFRHRDFWEMPGVAMGRTTSDLPDSVTPGSQKEGLALQGIGCNWCEEGGRPAGFTGTWEGMRQGQRGNLRAQRAAGVGELMRARVSPWVYDAVLDHMGGRAAEMADQTINCPNCRQILLVEHTG